MITYSGETQDLQIQGLDEAMAAHDFRYVETDEPMTWWTITLWGGLEVEILATTAGAIKIQAASEAAEAAGREPLFTIRGGRKIQ